eukprot:comp13710_c0_seq1/m.9379 comp13710_c0_seq1/g.9379  ORF comp13710_c0_seq1/g.9379 comp13710_c0_seq1/m.9379 type:complete len:109 (-) comp13710_c0_seq1:104-430(-)
MLLFCPLCANVLMAENEGGSLAFQCQTCPYIHKISKTISARKYMKMKEIDDVLGGEDAWENVDCIDADCPKCGHTRAYYMQVQTRSADEPSTIFYRCANHQCKNQWRE